MARIILLIVIFNLFGPPPKSPADFVWQNRILILKSDKVNVNWSSENQKLKDRKLLVFQFNRGKLISTNCQDQIDTENFLAKLDEKTGENIQWVLIGLDGGIKKSGKVIPYPDEIFKIIDAMPMRQSEINKSTNESF